MATAFKRFLPMTAPQPFFDLYPPERLPLPKQYAPAERPDHPYLREYHACVGYDDGFGARVLVR